MNVQPKKKNDYLYSLALSVSLHLLVIGLLSYQFSPDELTIGLKQSSHSVFINLGNFSGEKKLNVSPKISEMKSTSKLSLKQSLIQGSQLNDSNNTTSDNNAQILGDRAQENNEKYFSELRNLIEAKKIYPALAKKREIEGVVIISMCIKKNGELYKHQIFKSSGQEILDGAAFRLIMQFKSFKSLPESISKDEIEVKLPIAFELESKS